MSPRTATAARRLVAALAVVTALVVIAGGPLVGSGPHALVGGAIVAAVLSSTSLAVMLALAALTVVLLLGPPARTSAVRWGEAVAVVLDDQPGRPGRARPRAPGAGTFPRRLAR